MVAGPVAADLRRFAGGPRAGGHAALRDHGGHALLAPATGATISRLVQGRVLQVLTRAGTLSLLPPAARSRPTCSSPWQRA